MELPVFSLVYVLYLILRHLTPKSPLHVLVYMYNRLLLVSGWRLAGHNACMQHRPSMSHPHRQGDCLHVQLDSTPPPQASASVDARAAGATPRARPKHSLVRTHLRVTP